MSDHFRCMVGVPSGSHMDASFAMDLVNLVAAFTSIPVPGYSSQELRVINLRSSILPRNRMNLVHAAKAMHATHLLFLDSDHTFPKDLIQRLAAHRQLIVAANCVTKQIPARTTGRQKDANVRGGTPVFSDSPGLERVWRIGTGVMLIRMSVFAKIGNGCWDMKYVPEIDDYQGEDWSFCEACEKANIPIYVDHAVSRLVGHVGEMEYTHDLVGEIVTEA